MVFSLYEIEKKTLFKFIELTRCLEKGHLKHVDLNKKTWAFILALMQKNLRETTSSFFFLNYLYESVKVVHIVLVDVIVQLQ